MSIYLMQLAVVALFLLPALVYTGLRRRPERAPWELGLDLATGVAIDALSVLVLTLVVRFELSVWISRAIWTLLGIGGLARGIKLGGARALLPPSGNRRVLWHAFAVGVATFLFYAQLTRRQTMWDRQWHIPIVSVLRTQTLPFQNAFEPPQLFQYHFAGNVYATITQVLSGDRFHASLALSVSHDALLAMAAVVTVLLVGGFSRPRGLSMVGVVVAVLFAGPAALLQGGGTAGLLGYSTFTLFSIGLRPHVSVAQLMLAGLLGALFVRARWPGEPSARTLPALLACAGVLAIADEASLALTGLALSATWLFYPHIVAPTRLRGLVVFVGLAGAFLGPNVLFRASLSPGAQRHEAAFVPWNLPGIANGSLSMAHADVPFHLLCDYGGLVLLVLVLAWLAIRGDPRGARPITLFVCVVATIAFFLLTKLRFHGRADESHRFVTIFFVAIPMAIVMLMDGIPVRSIAFGLVVLGTGLPAASSLDWFVENVPTSPTTGLMAMGGATIHSGKCRQDTGRRVGSKAARPYVEPSVYYLYAGCHPIFYPADPSPDAYWVLKIVPDTNVRAFATVDARTPKDQPLSLVCSSAESTDPPCAWAKEQPGLCRTQGTLITACTVPAADRPNVPH